MANRITSPIGIYSETDVRTVIGEPSGDVATLCTSPYIKHWSKFKPMDMPELYYDTKDESKATFWKGKQGYLASIAKSAINAVAHYWPTGNVWWCYVCGVKFYICDNAVDLANIIYRIEPEDDMYEENFSWDKPKGGKNSPYRLTDFLHYDHRSECMFWTNLNTSPWLTDSRLPKYNLQNGADIVCSVNTWDWIYGISLIKMLTEGMGATNVKLCIMDFNEGNAYNDKSQTSNGTSIGIKEVDFTTDANIATAQTAIKPYTDFNDRRGAGNVFALVYMIRFDFKGTTYYMPLTQGYDGGANTDKSPFGNKCYAVRRYYLVAMPPVSLGIKEYKGSSGGWIDAYGAPTALQTAQLRLHFVARTSETDFRFDASKVKFEFVWNRPNTGDHGTHVIDGSAGYNYENAYVKASTKDDGRNEENILVPQNEDFNLYVTLPQIAALTENEGAPLQHGDKITQMTAYWRNNPSLGWENITSFNLNITIN